MKKDALLIQKYLRAMMVRPRPEWNKIGPRVPAWFKRALTKIDRRLTLQFLPPITKVIGGVPASMFPEGVWAILMKAPSSGLLHRRWTWNLCDHLGRYRQPGRDTIQLLRVGHAMYRNGDACKLERMFDDSVVNLIKAKSVKAKTDLIESIADRFRETAKLSFPNAVFCGKAVS